MNSFVLKGNVLFSENPDQIGAYPDHFLVCEDGLCRGVFRELPERYALLPVTDYGDNLIIPGLIDLHIHAPQYAYRGMGMDLELMDWLQQQAFLEEAKYADEAYANRAYSMFAEQMKKSATTRASIFATQHRGATEILMDLLEETGLVTCVGKVNMDQDAPDDLIEPSADISTYNTIGWINHTSGKYQRTKPILTPRFIPSCTKQLLEAENLFDFIHQLEGRSCNAIHLIDKGEDRNAAHTANFKQLDRLLFHAAATIDQHYRRISSHQCAIGIF